MKPPLPGLSHIVTPLGVGFDVLELSKGGFDICAGFTHRTGGVSRAPYASLNLGFHVGDEPGHVVQNHDRALAALAAYHGSPLPSTTVFPNQVHGTDLVTLASEDEVAHYAQRAGAFDADGLVTTIPQVALKLCFADCVPVLAWVAGKAVGVAHAGWRGVIGGIASKLVREVATCAQVNAGEVQVVFGPHIGGQHYEVSPELAMQFVDRFGESVLSLIEGRPYLSLTRALEVDLSTLGIQPLVEPQAYEQDLSTTAHPERYFSYRLEGPTCGRHALYAWLPA